MLLVSPIYFLTSSGKKEADLTKSRAEVRIIMSCLYQTAGEKCINEISNKTGNLGSELQMIRP